MRRALITLVLLVWLAPAAWAGSYPVTTSAAEDAALQWDLDTRVNPKRLQDGQAAWTVEEYVNRLANLNIKAVREAFQSQEIESACMAFRGLSDPDKQTVRQLLGGSPCR